MIAVYARVSTDEQAKNGYSLQDQIRECRIKAGSDDIKEYIDDGFSGEFLDRPGLSSLRQDVRDGLITKVVCLDPDRLSRKLVNSVIVADEIEKYAELVFVNGEYQNTPEGRLFYQMRGAVAEFEKAKINERMSRGRRQKARQGKVVKNPRVYGYDYDKENGKLVVNTREAEVVRWIFNVFTDPNSNIRGLNHIAAQLIEQGVPTKRGGIWHRQTVKQILKNRAYIGEVYQNRYNTEGRIRNKYVSDPSERVITTERPMDEWIRVECPAIIDVGQFDYAQKLLEKVRRETNGKTKRQYLLSGLCRCGDCGMRMHGRYAKRWDKWYKTYTDRQNSPGRNRGCGNWVRGETIEDKVWKHVIDYVTSKMNAESAPTVEQPSYEQSELARIDKELNRINTGRQKLLDLLMDDDIDDTDIRERLKKLQDQRQKLEERRNQLEQEMNNVKANDYVVDMWKQVWEMLKYVKPDEFEFDAKRNIIRSLVREIKIYNKGENVDIFMI
ncbi:recombinase family protein [Alicyclobacillus acidoterrestris]|uniref:Recombinase family protein n=1 Tax=Alicyclobacillus acidoterrestris (strain ATCC 49025 / DSM 3922 / CIP 106132 / NCIMB 13137 / GD3B) TaxID=1356854 RepID=T0BUJ8_ALIAG|nr:recombinase family protein [Alicyclobacillus acidoterrestris]EPZ47768.1 hypothetical protein N007_05805 [Alicyclobacillus acidoterrestris ATCC 49025]UNO47929.1 recombinase family protein [Alicyclobacillus acidoterrestris]